MATLTLGTHAPVEFGTWNIDDLFDYDNMSVTDTLIKFFDNGDNYIELTGTGFTADPDGYPVAGTVTGVEVVENDRATLTMADITIDVPTIVGFVNANDADGLMQFVLAGADSLSGSQYDDDLWGYAGNDTLAGDAGDDTLEGDDGADSLDGGAGDDTLQGGAGDDTLTGDGAVAGDVAGPLGKGTPIPLNIDLFYMTPGEEGFKLVGEAIDDNTGYSVAGIGDINGDGYDDLLIGAPENDEGADNAGAGYVVFGSNTPPSSIDLSNLGSNGIKLIGRAAGEGAGTYVSSAGDFNDDGIDDLLISAPNGSGGAGTAYVMFGKDTPFSTTIDLDSLGADGVKIVGESVGDRLGPLANLGDVNGDGIDDIAVGAYLKEVDGEAQAGATYVILGQDTPFSNTIDVANLGAGGYTITGANANDWSGVSVSGAGDFNGDGIGDLIIGAAQWPMLLPGEAFVVFGSDTPGDIDLGALGSGGVQINGAANALQTGRSVSGVGDVNGDGFDDVLVGTPEYGDGGVAYLIYGSDTPAASIDLDTPSSAFVTFMSDFYFDDVGSSVTGLGDINQDGFADLMIGAQNDVGIGIRAGSTYVILGSDSLPSTVGLGDIDTIGFEIFGEISGDAAGVSVSAAGDINGDGIGDLLVGAGGNDGGGENAGAAYVVYGELWGRSFAGHDLLDGGAGADAMAGGVGDDRYVVDNLGDTVTEDANAGNDTVEASVSHTLSDNVEALVLTGGDDVDGTGNGGANTLTGNSGDNRLDGGAGADAMAGGAGDDRYIVDDLGDTVSEDADAGEDTVEASVSHTLGNNVEALVLTGSDDIDGTGNGDANTLNGNSGENRLDGGGGADAMAGGAGDDFYVVENLGDTVSEDVDAGNDTVEASVSHTLSDNVEALVLTGGDDVDGTGNGDANALTGNSGDNRLDGGAGADAMTGGDGDDRYIVDDLGDTVSEDADAGDDTVEASVSHTLSDNVEALVLTGNDDIDGTGNDDANTLTGNSGDNRLDGGAGADVMAGGVGDDRYIVDDLGDTVSEDPDAGNDTVEASVSHTLGANVEALVLTGGDDIDGTGNDDANTLTGNSSDNRLDGGASADAMAGGAGDDLYIVDDLGDTVSEDADAGNDTVEASVDHTLGSNVENLVLTGGGDVDGTGNDDANTLTGNSSDNRLDGGASADAMAGGAGDDLYIVDDLGDTVSEDADAGNDTVEASVDHTLGSNVENLVLTGGGDVDGTGNDDANTLTGNSSDNRLDGGASADAMTGGDGDDRYIVDDLGDTVSEDADAGDDTVEASVSHTLSDNVEALVLTGNDDIDGTGNDDANTLTGNSGDNRLDGGAGADVMAGGVGDDRYIVDDLGDTVSEDADAGNDTVEASVDRTLGSNVENLVLTGGGDVDGTGNGGANTLIGNTGENRLNGGLGDDTLTGGEGRDTFTVELGSGTDVDTITDFVSGLDVIDLSSYGADIGNWAALSEMISEDGADTRIDLPGGDQLILLGVDGSTLDADDFEGTGNTDANVLMGNNEDNGLDGGAGNDTLMGDAGNDTLDGGTGADSLAGGAGDDLYIVDNPGDTVSEDADAGNDTVEASVNFTLPSNVENLVLTGGGDTDGTGNGEANAVTGNSGDNQLDGGAGDDTLSGGAGNDTLDGGTGADSMEGGAGDDLYIVDTLSDTVSEDADAGNDTVEASVSFTLSPNVENLVLTGGDDIDCTGNANANALTGNGGDNRLDGGAGDDTLGGGSGNDTLMGGAGADAMAGGAGDDLYMVDNAGDTASEDAGAGNDTVEASINYTLGQNVEALVLTGSDDIDGTGNDDANALTGNSGNNRLDGGAGADEVAGGDGNDSLLGGDGDDTLLGGDGDDILIGDNAEISLRISFLDEDAGYRNVYGWYNSESLEAKILVANVDIETNLALQDFETEIPVDLGELDQIGFFLIPNGYDLNSLGDEPLAGDDPTSLDLEVFEDGGDWKIKDAASGYVFEGRDHSAFFTDMTKNADGQDHVVREGDLGDGEVELFWEDFRNLGDRDFNDLAFKAKLVVDSGGGDQAGNELVGGLGDDTLVGGNGDDTLTGDLGKDLLVGGKGADKFVFDSLHDSSVGQGLRDSISDFNSAEGDLIELYMIDADILSDGQQVFNYIGDEEFSGTSTELRFDRGVLQADVDGDMLADMEISVSGASSLAEDDFIL